jgi:hypothetical protein
MEKRKLRNVFFIVWGGVLGLPTKSFLHQYEWYQNMLSEKPWLEYVVIGMAISIGASCGFLLLRIADFKFWTRKL